MKKTLLFALVLVLCLLVFTACDEFSAPPAGEDLGMQETPDSGISGDDPSHVCFYGEWTTIIEPTCGGDGKEKRICSCGGNEERTVVALGHDEQRHVAKAPTCTEIGWSAYETCSRCDYSTYVEKAALGHDEQRHAAKAPTCTEIGWSAYETCSRCDYSTYSARRALGHAEVKYATKEPTCLENGHDAYVICYRCDYSTYVEKAALGHDEQTITEIPATCGATGLTEGKWCVRCKEVLVEQKIVEKTKHYSEVIDPAVAPTCTTTGLTQGTHCSVCCAILVEQTVIPMKHNYDHNYVCVDCTEQYYSRGLVFELNEKGTEYSVVGYEGQDEIVVIPLYYNSLPVTVLKKYSFQSVPIRELVITDNITTVEDYVLFNCHNTRKVYVGAGAKEIGIFAFNHWGLEEIHVSEKNTEYASENGVLYNKNKTELITYPQAKEDSVYRVPDSVVFIREYAFSGASHVEKLIIGNGVERIGHLAFQSTDELKDIKFGNNVSYIGQDTFLNSGMAINPSNWQNDVLYIESKDGRVKYVVDAKECVSGCVVLDEKTRLIGSYAFMYCSKITEMVLPESIKYINESAFHGCNSLVKINVPNDVRVLKSHVFYECSSLRHISFGSAIEEIEDGCFMSCTSLTYIKIPDTVKKIGGVAFAECISLQTVILSDYVESIPRSIFRGCCSLKYVDIGEGVKSVEEFAFEKSDNIQMIFVGSDIFDFVFMFDSHLLDKLCNSEFRCDHHLEAYKLTPKCGSSIQGVQYEYCDLCGFMDGILSFDSYESHSYQHGKCEKCGAVDESAYGFSYLDRYNSRYGYNRLGEFKNGQKMQELYNEIDRIVKRIHVDKTITAGEDGIIARINYVFYDLTNEEAEYVWNTYEAENPLYYWVASWSGVFGNTIAIWCDSTFASGDIRVSVNKLLYENAERYLQILDKDSLDVEKAQLLHDLIIKHTEYSWCEGEPDASRWAHSSVGVLLGFDVVCEGYARTYQLLLNMLDIENLYVIGLVSNIGHAWNYVFLNGAWYGYDLTWDDYGGDSVDYTYAGASQGVMSAGREIRENYYPFDLPLLSDTLLVYEPRLAV